MGWSEVVYFNVFYAVVAVLVVTGVVSLLLWLAAGIEQFSNWLARVFSPKVVPEPGAEELELSQIKAILARHGGQWIGKQGDYQTRLVRLSLENCRFRKEALDKDARVEGLVQTVGVLERRITELQNTLQPLQAEADNKDATINQLMDQLANREMELDAIAEAYQTLIDSHDRELKHLVRLVDGKPLDEVTLKRGRTYLKRDIKTMRKVLLDLEASAAGRMSRVEPAGQAGAARPNGAVNGHAGALSH